MFQQIIDKGLKPSTAAGAKRVLSVALSHARKYRYIETNAAKDTLTKFGKGDKTPDPYTPEQVKALMQRVEGTVWEMPVVLGGLYGMRRSEILGLRWRNVDLENNTFEVSEQLPFKVPPKTKVIEEMAPPKSNGRKLPITEVARPFFLKQFAMQEEQKEQAAKDGKPYYDNDLVVAKPDGAPISASWVSSQFGKLLEDLDMPHIRFHDLRHTAATNMHQLTGDFYTVGEVLGHTLAGIGASLGLSMNFEAVTARYVDVRLERKKEVLDAYHGAVKQADPKQKEAVPQKPKSAAKKKSSDVMLKGHSGDSIRVDRIGRNSESIMNPALTVLLTVQPNVLSGMMQNGIFRGRGLTARFLYCMPTSIVGQRKYRTDPIPAEVSRNYAALIRNLLEDEQQAEPEEISLSTEADRLLEDFSGEVECRLRTEYTDIADWAGKLVGAVLRIAGVLCRASVTRCYFLEAPEPLVVNAETMQNAISIGRYFTEHSRAAFSLMGADALAKQSQYLLDAICKNGLVEFTRRDIMRLCRSFKTAEEVQPVLNHLAEYGYIATKGDNTPNGKGRPAGQVYLVNPCLYEKAS